MSGEDVSYDVPTVRVAEASFEVVVYGGRKSDRWLTDDQEHAEMWAGKLRAARGADADIEIHELHPMGRAA